MKKEREIEGTMFLRPIQSHRSCEMFVAVIIHLQWRIRLEEDSALELLPLAETPRAGSVKGVDDRCCSNKDDFLLLLLLLLLLVPLLLPFCEHFWKFQQQLQQQQHHKHLSKLTFGTKNTILLQKQ